MCKVRATGGPDTRHKSTLHRRGRAVYNLSLLIRGTLNDHSGTA